METVLPHADGHAAWRFWLFAAGRAAGQRAYRQQPAGNIKPGAARLYLAVALAFALAFASRLPGLRWLSNALQSLPALFISLPTFWLGIALIQIFSFQLRWIPVINPGPIEGLILPIIAVAVPISAPLAQILMRSLDQVATQPFVAVARAKGLSETGALWRHVTGNALLPVLNIAGLLLGELIAGALITETVFGRGGLGLLTQQAVNNQDIAVLQVVVMISPSVSC